jgi:hypothetical protein
MEKISRQDAIAQGLSYYHTGVPCKRGHITKRHVTSGGCVDCMTEFSRLPKSLEKKAAWRRTDRVKEMYRNHSRKFHADNRAMCLEKMRVSNPIYYQKNKEHIKKQVLAYQTENAAARTDYKKRWSKERAKVDPVYKMSLVCRRMLHRALGVSGQKKYKRTQDYLPYTYSQLVERLESQFQPGMSWENYGEWHIDHKAPLAYFIKTGIIEPAIINALDNLQPLWKKDNMEKGHKYQGTGPVSDGNLVV